MDMKVKTMKAALFEEDGRPGRLAFTMSRWNLLRLSFNALRAAVFGEKGIAIRVGDLELLEKPND